ncbi:hypothetical protein MNBD_BACTEROID01-468 [hydrothermal vent metagenome]|uniref:Helix-hairpin-helix domain-containing protein n=1 Tax=hydrothermal vent metagenome TaxID=652676 RepID=A0A3B0TL36_9ZZZZ
MGYLAFPHRFQFNLRLMIKSFRYVILLIFSGIFFISEGQDSPDPSQDFETIIESLNEDLEDEADYEPVLENLESFFESPLNINSATVPELQKLFFLNEIQINNLLEYRKRTGEIYSIYELNAVEGFNREVLEKIAPFIRFGSVKAKDGRYKIPLKYGRHQVLLRSTGVLQKAKGYRQGNGKPPKYEGGNIRIYTRYRFLLGDKASAGFTAEKDPGEAFFSGSNKSGFDYYSGHISIGFNSIVQNITIGDFLVRAGQGLVLWQGFSPGKSSDVMAIAKNIQGISPYTSTDENRFFRGAGASLKINDFNLNFFFSQKKRDANLAPPDTSGIPGYFTSLQVSGLHRTGNETDDEKSIRETAAGAFVSYQKNRLKVGATFFYQQFNLPLVLKDAPYNYYKFSGVKNMDFGIDYRYLTGICQLFGEAAISQSGGLAFLQGIKAHLHDRVDYSVLFRHFERNYQALYSNAFSEGSANSNETGLYFGASLLPARNFRLSGYADLYKSPWLSYTTIAPSKGHDILVQLDYRPSQKLQLYARFKNETKEVKVHIEKKYVNTPLNTKRARLHLQYSPTGQIILKSRFEYAFYKKYKKEYGFLLYQDVVYSPVKIPFKGYMRVAVFKTDSYNSRIYAYENDLLYNYSIPAYYGNGFRVYLNTSYKFSTFLGVWLKLSNTTYSDRESIGSGYNEVDGRNLTEVKIQARLKF